MVAALPFVAAMKAEYCVCSDKIFFKRFINVRQIFKEALAVFFMGTLVKRRRLEDTKREKRNGAFVSEEAVRGDARTHKKKKRKSRRERI